MTHLVGELTAGLAGWIALHPVLTLFLAWLVAAGEAIIVVGALVPGTPILMAIGAAAGLGHVSLSWLVAAAIAGAISGDGLSYWVGRRHGAALLRGWPFATRPGVLARGQHFIDHWGVAGVALARFLPGVRAVVPVAAGMLGMRPMRFLLVNIASAAVWAPAHVLPGALLGLLSGRHLSGHAEIALALPAAAILGGLAWYAMRRGAQPMKGPGTTPNGS